MSLYRVISLSARRRHWLSSEKLTTDDVLLHVRADTCIRDCSSIPAIALASFAVLFCASWVLWFGSCTLRLKWLPLTGALERNIHRKETRKPSDKHKNKSFKKSHFPRKRIIGSVTAKNLTTGLSTRPIAVAAARFRPLSESQPAHCRHISQTTRLRR